MITSDTSKYSQSELISRALTYLESVGYKVKTEGNLLDAVKAERGLYHFSFHNVAYWLLRKKCRITVDATSEGKFTMICQGEKAVAEAEKLSSMLKG